MALDFLGNAEDITLGPCTIKIYSRDQSGCYQAGCLTSARFNYARSFQTVICNLLDGPADIRPLQPGASISLAQKELSAINFALSAPTATAIQTGTNIDTTIGTPGAASTVADPVEWHVVSLARAGGSGPYSFNLYTANKDLFYASSSFVLNTDVSIYSAVYTNGNASVSALSGGSPAFAIDITAAAANSFYVADACLGKLAFHAMASALLNVFVWDAAAPPFTINGIRPIIEPDVRQGDSVGLIGVSYKWGSVLAADGTQVGTKYRQKVKLDNARPNPVGILLSHEYQVNRTQKRLLIRLWKAMAMGGFGLGFDAEGASPITLDTTYTAIVDKLNHSESPLGEIEIVDYSAALA